MWVCDVGHCWPATDIKCLNFFSLHGYIVYFYIVFMIAAREMRKRIWNWTFREANILNSQHLKLKLSAWSDTT